MDLICYTQRTVYIRQTVNNLVRHQIIRNLCICQYNGTIISHAPQTCYKIELKVIESDIYA